MSPADAVFDGQILHGLQEQLDTRYLALQRGREPTDDVDGRNSRALFERLQGDLDAAAVHRRIYAVGPNEGCEILNRRILANDLNQFLLQSGHGGKRDCFGGL